MADNDEIVKERDKYLKLDQLYLSIILRYKDYIEEKESISVAELPKLVVPKNEKVESKSNEIKSSFGNYNYEDHFYQASIIAFSFVKEEIANVVLPLEFWLTPDETIGFMMGDSIDKNILLCSMLINLGNPSAKVLVYSKESTRKTFVYCDFKEKAHLFDIAGYVKEFATREEIIKYVIENDKNEDVTLYEFNDRMYVDLI